LEDKCKKLEKKVHDLAKANRALKEKIAQATSNTAEPGEQPIQTNEEKIKQKEGENIAIQAAEKFEIERNAYMEQIDELNKKRLEEQVKVQTATVGGRQTSNLTCHHIGGCKRLSLGGRSCHT